MNSAKGKNVLKIYFQVIIEQQILSKQDASRAHDGMTLFFKLLLLLALKIQSLPHCYFHIVILPTVLILFLMKTMDWSIPKCKVRHKKTPC